MRRTASHVRGHLMRRVLLSCLLVSIGANAALTAYLRHQYAALREVRLATQLRIGDTVRSLSLRALDGGRVQVPSVGPDKPTVLYVFHPKCGWCKRNEPNVGALSRGIRDRFTVVGLSMASEGLDAYVNEWHPEFPVFHGLTVESAAAYHLGGTPRTIVVSRSGRVLKVWYGYYAGATKREIEKYFAVTLPPANVE